MKESGKYTAEPWEEPVKHKRGKALPVLCVVLSLCVVFLSAVCLHYVKVNGALAQENINLSGALHEAEQNDQPASFSEWSKENKGDDAQGGEPTVNSYTDRPLMPVFISSGDIVKEPAGERLAPLEIVTTGEAGYYISLKPTAPPFSNSMRFYVWGGQSEEVLVPLGEYEIYYAVGEMWYGEEELFGAETAYYKCDGTFDFYKENGYYQGWTLELFLQSNGNMDTDEISADDFPM